MPDKKIYLVATICDSNGKVLFVSKVSNMNEREYTKLKNKAVAYEEENKKAKFEQNTRIANLEKLVEELQDEIKHLKGEE